MKKDKKIFNSRTMPYFMLFLLLGTVMGTTMVTSYIMSSDNVWLDRGDGTVVLLNTLNNVLIGENRTTSYRLEVNGTALINGTLYIDRGSVPIFPVINNLIDMDPSDGPTGAGWYSPSPDDFNFRGTTGPIVHFGQAISSIQTNFGHDGDVWSYWRNVNQRINASQWDTLDIHALHYIVMHSDFVNFTGDINLLYNNLTNANLSEYAGDNLFWDWNTFTLNTTWFNPFNQSLNTTDNVEFVDIYATGNIETDGYVSSDSYVETGYGVYHKDDANTYLYFTPDRMRFYVGGMNFLDMEESTPDRFIVNPDRYDIDFIVYGDNEYDVLKVDAGQDAVHAGHGIQRGYVTTSRDYTVTSADNFIYVETSSGNVDIDLPDATANNGMTLTIFHLGGGNRVDINGYSTQNINGAGTQSLTAQYDSITIHANKKEAEWFIISDTR